MRLALAIALLIGAIFAAPAATAADVEGDVWNDLAGMDGELEAEGLELRDELIAAHLAYLATLETALTEIDAMPVDAARLPLAWARAEYLLETCYRLLADTGEFEGFLKATHNLRPGGAPAEADIAIDETAAADGDDAGGLTFVDVDGAPLSARKAGDGWELVDASGKAVPSQTKAAATPTQPATAAASPQVELIRARAAWLRGRVLERLGRVGEAATETAGLGLIRNWLLLGPIDNDVDITSYQNSGLDGLYRNLLQERPFNGKNGMVDWRPFASADPLGRLQPGALFRSSGMNTVFALALVYSPENAPAVVRFGSNAPATVCVNHIHARRQRLSGQGAMDQEAFNVWLRRGWNTVLVRTASQSHDWKLSLRLTRPDGSPFPMRTAAPDAEKLPELLRLAAGAAARSLLDRFYQPERLADLGGVTRLSSWVGENLEDARGNFYLASLLVAKRMMEGPERFDRELIFRRATEYSGGNPYFTLMAARSVDSGMEGPDREENLRLVLLRLVADQGAAAALVDIGRLYLDVMRQPRRADEYAEYALEVNPVSLRAGVLDYDVAVAMQWEAVADSLLKKLVNRHPNAAAARLRLGRAALAGGRPRQALAEFHAILAIDATNAEALDGVVASLGMLGQTSAAVDLLVGHIGKFPYDFDVRIKLAELYRTLGRDADAEKIIDAALELAPDDAAALAMRRDIGRETYAEGRSDAEPDAGRRLRQELDLSPPKRQPANGWEYLYFQVEDRMRQNGSIRRTVSFALRIYTPRAARMLRHLGFWLERDFESGRVTMLNLIQPEGQRETFTPPAYGEEGGGALRFQLPPLRIGTTVEAEVAIERQRVAFLGDYFGQIAPLTQQAPVRLSRYMFTAPKDRRLFFRPVNGAPEAMVVDSPDGQEVTRIWEMSNLEAFIPEPDSPGQHSLMPCVQVSSFNDWDDFARWYWRLIGVQYHTPPEMRILAASIAGDEPLPMARLDRAAEWVAKNIGHREWEYGPYAFRPINARSILSRLSADGKDRTLFLCLLAREYGLEAWPVLARLRDRRFGPTGQADLSLPLLDHFNHSLVMVESMPGGDVFLDASNPFRSPGVMPSQLFGSPGMAMLSGSAERVLIPDGGVAACTWEETGDLVMDEDGSALWEEEIRGEGTAAETLRMRFRNPATRSDAWFSFLTSLGATPSATWEDFSEVADEPAAAFSGRARLRQLAAVEDGRVIVTVPALPGAAAPAGGEYAYPVSLREFAGHGVRTQDLILPHGFRIARRLRITYPSEWRLVNPPSSFRVVYPFGAISLAAEQTPGSLELEFAMETPGHRVAAADYPAFREMATLAKRWLSPLLVWEKP